MNLLQKIANFDYSGKRRLYVHIAFWIIWLGFIFFYERLNFLPKDRYIPLLLFLSVRDFLLVISLFYSFSYDYLLFLRKKYIFALIFFIFLCFGTYSYTYFSHLVSIKLFPEIKGATFYAEWFVRDGFGNGIFRQFTLWYLTSWYSLYIIVPLLIKFLIDLAEFRIKNIRLAQENMRLELDYLKSQVNPHFLFNVLNSIYSIVVDSEPKASEIILKLSDLMRYSLYETNQEQVSLAREIKFIEDYVALEQIRQKKSNKIGFEHTGDATGLFIPPFLLINFVENAFKHGMYNTTQAAWVKINLSISNKTLQFIVENSKPLKLKDENIQGGIGLLNVRKRLDYLFPNRYHLKINNIATSFTAHLTIFLN